MLEENNNDPNNNMDNENLEGLNPPYRPPSPQPGCSRHFDSMEDVNTIADNILQSIKTLLGSINHTGIVHAIQTNLRNGNNKLSFQDLLPSDLKVENSRKRRNSEDISGVDVKKSRGNGNLSPMLAGFLAGNPVDIYNFSTPPLHATPQKSGKINIVVPPDMSTSIEIVSIPQTAAAGSSVDKTVTNTGNNVGTNNDIIINIDEYEYECHRTKLESATERKQLDANLMLNQIKKNMPAMISSPAVPSLRADGPIQVNNLLPPRNQAQPNLNKSNIGNKVCEEIYQKLRAMFPALDREYIKTFCPTDWLLGMGHDVQLSSIVERILLSENSWVMDAKETSFQAEVVGNCGLTPNVNDTFDHLTGIFPNADPHYLRSAAERFKNENEVTAFVDEKLKSNDYPTREQYLAKIKVTEEQQRYTKNFNVEQFLSLFPDPFKHFEDSKRTFKSSWVVFEFLKDEFRRVRVNTIMKWYRCCSYNMSLTAKNLRLSTDFIMTPRRRNEIPTEDISLLQEMAFVRHHEEIRKHMETIKHREEEEFNSLKAAGGLRTCQCCYDEECMPSKCSTCDNDHIFCNSCVVSGTDSKLGDGETHVPCFLNCGSEFSISTLQRVLPPTKFSILLKKRQAAEVMAAGLEGLVSCPFCHFASIPAEGDKVFKCFNPECMKESCIKCKEPNHVPYKCGELIKKEEARKYIEEKMTQALTRICYKCKKAFFKEEGCNKMLCPCGATMCYICNQPVVNYNHFQGQGSTETNKCPLWSDSVRLNAEIVRKVEEDARKKFLRQNPNLAIDTTRLAPVLPPPTAGPHNDLTATGNLALETNGPHSRHGASPGALATLLTTIPTEQLVVLL